MVSDEYDEDDDNPLIFWELYDEREKKVLLSVEAKTEEDAKHKFIEQLKSLI